MKKPFFIMAYSQNGEFIIPIMNIDMDTGINELAQYATREEAEEVAQSQILCKHFGYEVYEMGGFCD